jgi:nucleoside-diphosphate-sugar epimerase
VEAGSETVIITGTSGRIGAALAARLCERYRVIGFDRRPAACAPAAAECLRVDLTDEESLRRGLLRVNARYGREIAAVVHLAGFYEFSRAESPEYEEVNVRGTERLLRGLRGFRVEQFLFASTMLVHRPCEPGERIREDSPLLTDAEWEYPRSKLRGEEVVRRERAGTPVVLARLAAVYDEWCRLVPLARQMQRIYERRLTGRLFPGDPARGLTYLHLDDAVEALVRMVERRAGLSEGTALLVGEDEPAAYGWLQEELGRLLHGREWETLPIPSGAAKAGAWLQDRLPLGEEPFIKPWMIDRADFHYALDTGRARALLDWRPAYRLPEMLPRIAARLREEPRRWYAENELEPPAWLRQRRAA